MLVSANFGNLNPFTLLKLLNCCVLPDEVTLVGELLRSANGELTLQPLSQEQAKRNFLDGHRVYKCGGRYIYIYIFEFETCLTRADKFESPRVPQVSWKRTSWERAGLAEADDLELLEARLGAGQKI